MRFPRPTRQLAVAVGEAGDLLVGEGAAVLALGFVGEEGGTGVVAAALVGDCQGP